MIRPRIACAVLGCACAITLNGQSKTPGNQTPIQATSSGNPPGEQPEPPTTYQIFNTHPDQRNGDQEKSYGRQFVEHLATDPIVWLTGALTFLAVVQLVIYRAEVRDTRAIERAYVKMTHNLPGLVIDTIEVSTNGGPSIQDVSVRMAVHNRGNTPAQITEIAVKLFFSGAEELSGNPDYKGAQVFSERVFLVRDDKMTSWLNYPVEARAIERVRRGEEHLFLIGYVDYIDRFEQRHRAGYARIYMPAADAKAAYTDEVGKFSAKDFRRRTNLGFIKASNFSYDRLRLKGEGSDWGKENDRRDQYGQPQPKR